MKTPLIQMVLHNHPTAEIWQDNSLSTPYFTDPHGSLKMFDFVVANPPFSKRAWSNGFDPLNDLYERFNHLPAIIDAFITNR